MTNILHFPKDDDTFLERDRIQREMKALTKHIEYLEGLVTDSPIAELGVDHRTVGAPSIKRSILRTNEVLRKEISVLKGRRTRLENELLSL